MRREAPIHPAVAALGLTLVAAALEGIGAGTEVRGRLAEVQQPAGSPPLPLWIGVAALYYVTCFIIAMRLLGVGSRSAPAAVAFGLLVALLLGNILWNAAFFRARALRLSWWVALSYWVAAMALAVTLWRVDRVALAVFVPYFIICSTAPGGSTRFVG